jgi:hypothetical protein
MYCGGAPLNKTDGLDLTRRLSEIVSQWRRWRRPFWGDPAKSFTIDAVQTADKTPKNLFVNYLTPQKIQNKFFYRVNDRVEYLLCRGFLLTQQFFAWKLIGVAPCGEFEKTTKTF